MNHLMTCSLALLTCAGLAAQQNYYVSPPGTESLEGNSSSSIQLNYAQSRVQQIDNSLVGANLPLIRSIAWRRDRNLTTSATHTLEIEILMSHANFATVTSTYASNYKGTPTVAFKKKKIKLDWTKASPLRPADYDAIFPFDQIFIYNRTDALLWETKTTTGTAGPGYSQDWFSGSSPATLFGPRPSALGKGCTTPNGTMTLTSSFRSNSPTNFDYGFGLTGGPASQPAILFIGLGSARAPLFCGSLEINPIANVPLGSTSASGAVPLRYATTTWAAALKDFNVYTQVLALDKSQTSGVALSNGLHSRVMRQPGGSAAYAIKRSFSLNSSTATTGSSPSLSSVATKYTR